MVPTLPAPGPHVVPLRRGLVLRGASLLVTLYGDALAPRAQAVPLASLIALAGLFGLSSRLVRTSVFRLGADDWLAAERQGRRSSYRLTRAGEQHVQHAGRRIYDFAPQPWSGRWTLVIVDQRLAASTRRHLQRELLWDSFGQLAPGLYAHPRADHRALQEIVDVTRSGAGVAVMVAETAHLFAAAPLRQVLADTFRLDVLAGAWAGFCRRFGPLEDSAARLGPCDAFFARTLLVHEYRRVLLRDPDLPAEFLPAGWPGSQARALCSRLHAALLPASEAFLDAVLQPAAAARAAGDAARASPCASAGAS